MDHPFRRLSNRQLLLQILERTIYMTTVTEDLNASVALIKSAVSDAASAIQDLATKLTTQGSTNPADIETAAAQLTTIAKGLQAVVAAAGEPVTETAPPAPPVVEPVGEPVTETAPAAPPVVEPVVEPVAKDPGADTIAALEGDATTQGGGSGTDSISAGAGADTLTGGQGIGQTDTLTSGQTGAFSGDPVH